MMPTNKALALAKHVSRAAEIEHKTCTKCCTKKELKDFYLRSDTDLPNVYQSRCKQCWQTAKREWRKLHSNIDKEQRLRHEMTRLYGMSANDFEDLLKTQNNVCAICGDSASGFKQRLSVDHDHLTGQLRGLLCHYCNMGLGSFRDSPDRLLAAIDYLRRPRKTKIVAGKQPTRRKVWS
jgi:hypothetical protein